MPKDENNPMIDYSVAPSVIRKPAEFLQKYWYYYRTPVLMIGIFVVVIILVIVSAVTNKGVDYTVCVASNLVIADDQNRIITENLKPYLDDIDGNNKLNIASAVLYLDPEQAKDEYAAAQSDQLTLIMVNKEVVFFVADEYSVSYMKKMGMIEPFSVIGAGDSTEYAVQISENDILSGSLLAGFNDYYICVKTESEMYKTDKEYIARRAGAAALIEALKNK